MKYEINEKTKFLIVGLGLMGGSYAMALSKRGYDVSAITLEGRDIDYALARGMIARGSTEPDAELIGSADVVISALYPEIFVRWVSENQQKMRPGALLTDVTGVKSTVVARIGEILRDDVEFIAAHPMAGRERSGVEHSDDSVFKGANYIVTPTEKNTPEAIAACRRLGEVLGFAGISELGVAEHDETIAFLSQLTHCIAVTLMTCSAEKDGIEKYTGDSFRDLTRIAKINDLMWSELFLMNKDALLAQMDSFAAEFGRFRYCLARGDKEELRRTMRLASERRSHFDKSN